MSAEAASDIIECLLPMEHPLEAEMMGCSLREKAAGLILLDKANASASP